MSEVVVFKKITIFQARVVKRRTYKNSCKTRIIGVEGTDDEKKNIFKKFKLHNSESGAAVVASFGTRSAADLLEN
ncbi:MAG: hypothetical protein LBD40_03395 [Puniceicoccales bacterium]|nr:hypothetical protein [Puniceicoccales bacterium]